MEAHVEHDWARGTHKVWLYTRAPGGMMMVMRHRGGDVWEQIEAPEASILPEPTFILPRGALSAIIAAGGDILPPSAATDRHLKDSNEVRDRLLTLVEKLSEPLPPLTEVHEFNPRPAR